MEMSVAGDATKGNHELLKAALDSANKGVPVFPCWPGTKKPKTDNGFKDATTDTDQITRWWVQWPDSWIGRPTGDVTVVDVDPDKGGHLTLKVLESMFGPVPDTRKVKSPSGGYHLYFKGAGLRNTAGVIGPGIDVRGEGGYVIIPPSPGYQDLNGSKLKSLPAWLNPTKTVLGGRGKFNPIRVMKGVRQGQRDDMLFRLASWLRSRDFSQEEAEEIVALAADNCAPEFDRATALKKVEGAYSRYEPNEPPEEIKEGKETKEEKRSQPDRLIEYALATGSPLFLDHLGAAHVLAEGEAIPLNSRCYPWLRKLMWVEERKSASAEALKQAAGTLEALAIESCDERVLYTRAAEFGGAIYYQLGKGRVVEIDRDGWRMVADPPVLFRSIPNLKNLPTPVRGGSLEPLHDLINLKDKRDRRLFNAYIALLPLADIPRPMLQPTGQQGSGKTTLSRLVKRTLDPSAPEAVRLDPRDFLQKAAHTYIVMLDNQNSIPEWAADTLCRLVTGESDSKRRLYTDDEDVIVEMKRAVLINGINTPSERGDVQERTLPLELDRIKKTERRSEKLLWARFEKSHPAVLGAIFDTLSGSLRLHDTLTFDELPRLADWAEFAAAAYEYLGYGADQFKEDWGKVEERQNESAIDGSSVAQAIIAIMKVHSYFEKKPAAMLETLEIEAEKLKINVKRDKTWPKSPRSVWKRINEVRPALGAYGISADRSRDSQTRTIILKLDTPPDNDDISDNSDDISDESNVTANVIREPASTAEKSHDDISDISDGDISDPLSRRISKMEGEHVDLQGESPENVPETSTLRETSRTDVINVIDVTGGLKGKYGEVPCSGLEEFIRNTQMPMKDGGVKSRVLQRRYLRETGIEVTEAEVRATAEKVLAERES